MSDVLDRLVGQPRAVAAMRNLLGRPVHAYLISGPAGSAVNEAARLFATSLLCARGGCGNCEDCRSSLAGSNANLLVPTRAANFWSVAEVRSLDELARKRPLGPGKQVIVVENVDLMLGASPSASAFLKTLEEPSARTIFVLTADELPEELVTIRSRCVEVRLAPLSTSAIAAVLEAEGHGPSAAADAASAAAGSVTRARLLVRDSGLRSRLALWRAVPEQVSTFGESLRAANDILAAIDDALAPLVAEQARAFAVLEAQAKEQKLRGVPRRDEIETAHKREQRRFRTQEFAAGFAVVTDVYRERLHRASEDLTRGDERASRRAEAASAAIELVARAAGRLDTNLNESLLLHDLFFALGAL